MPTPLDCSPNPVPWPLYLTPEQEEDIVSIMATVERGIAAGATAATTGSPWPAESYTSRRNPHQFALAEVSQKKHSYRLG